MYCIKFEQVQALRKLPNGQATFDLQNTKNLYTFKDVSKDTFDMIVSTALTDTIMVLPNNLRVQVIVRELDMSNMPPALTVYCGLVSTIAMPGDDGSSVPDVDLSRGL